MLDAAGAAARRPGQCAIVLSTGLLSLIHGSLWMDNLFIALRRTGDQRAAEPALITCGNSERGTGEAVGGSMWMTRSIIQGDTIAGSPEKSGRGVAVYSAPGFAANGVFL